MVNAVEKGRINKIRFKEYVDGLRKTGKKFPVNQHGDVNLTQIGKACGFNRQVFGTNDNMATALNDAVKELGTELTKPRDPDEFLSKKVSENEKLIGQLRKENVVQKETIDSMKKQLLEAEIAITRLENLKVEDQESFDYMLQSGRRFVL